MSTTSAETRPLQLLSVIIPARDEEKCIASTVEHLHIELKLRDVPHEIVVVDDGSKDKTWQILQQTSLTLPNLRPVQNNGLHGFGREADETRVRPRSSSSFEAKRACDTPAKLCMPFAEIQP